MTEQELLTMRRRSIEWQKTWNSFHLIDKCPPERVDADTLEPSTRVIEYIRTLQAEIARLGFWSECK